MDKVIISRDCSDYTYCEEKKQLMPVYDYRVYVVGPLWQQNGNYLEACYTSTPIREKASRFDRNIAEMLIVSGKWKQTSPLIEDPAVSSKGCES